MIWADRAMRNMAGRKSNSAEDIVRKLRRADELTAAGKTEEEIARQLDVSVPTLYNWCKQYGGMDSDAAKELKELREQNGKLKRLLADAELEKDALREVAKDAPIDVKWSARGMRSSNVIHEADHFRSVAWIRPRPRLPRLWQSAGGAAFWSGPVIPARRTV